MTDSHGPESINKVMVVDDDPEIVATVRNMLEQNDFNVRCALSGAQLFNGLEEQLPDLILLDVVMPQMLGADYYITKPFTTGQLVSGISSILS
jgi:DNA-binding response OmpR family regulator